MKKNSKSSLKDVVGLGEVVGTFCANICKNYDRCRRRYPCRFIIFIQEIYERVCEMEEELNHGSKAD